METNLDETVSKLTTASYDIWRAEVDFNNKNKEEECDYNSALGQILHGIWNEIDAVIMLIEKRPF